MTVSMDIKLRLLNIMRAYAVFLKDSALKDAHLARMTFFWTVKKEYLSDPLENQDDQNEVLRHLDQWMEHTYQKMVEEMPSTPLSFNLHVATKR